MRIASTKPHNNKAREILTKEYLTQEYIAKGRSAGSIGRELGVHQSVVLRQLRWLGFEIRPNGSYDTSSNFGKYSKLKYQDILTKDYSQREYIEKKTSAAEIGSRLGASSYLVLKYLRRLGFPIRNRAFYVQGERNNKYGKKLSQSAKDAISEANKGKPCFWKGKHLPEKTRKLISAHHADFRLEKHPRWQGGRSFEPYPIEFNRQLKETIRDRDKHTCQLCGALECECYEKLHIHHIDYDKGHCLSNNLISLCRSCHTKTNENREYWMQELRRKDKVLAR